ncbi:putative polycomb protein embryonic flower [Capsicum annuum]|nr:putative polycomb protein embryonic flower [Capsicum annuum]
MAHGIEEEHVETLSMNGNNKMQVKNFIWSEEEWPTLKHDDFGDVEEDIPVISLNNLIRGNDDQQLYDNLCQGMVKASENWGFFKLVDHGVSSEIVENFTTRLHELFDLPMEQKVKGGKTSSLPLGYYALNPEYGQNLSWAEVLQLLQSQEMVVEFAKRYMMINITDLEYLKEMNKLGMIIFEMLAHGLGLEDEHFFIRAEPVCFLVISWAVDKYTNKKGAEIVMNLLDQPPKEEEEAGQRPIMPYFDQNIVKNCRRRKMNNRFSTGSTTHVEDDRNDFLRIFVDSSFWECLVDSEDGGVVVENGSNSSLVIEVKEKKDNDPIFLPIESCSQ